MKTVLYLIAVVVLVSSAVYVAPAKAHQEEHESALATTKMAASEENHESNWHEVIEVLGIITFTCLLITACAGYFMSKKRNLLFKWHKRFAVITIISAMVHGILVMLIM